MPSTLRISAVLTLTALSTLCAQTDHRTLSGDRVAVYNIVGKLKVQATSGSQVTVDVTRGGHDAGQLKIATGNVHGLQTLRVVYPSDEIIYPELEHRTRTQIRVNDDGTFDNNYDGSDRDRNRVEIRDSGNGLEAHADITVGVPKGQRIDVHLGVGEAVVSNVDGDLSVSVASSHLSSEHTHGRLRLATGSGGLDVTDANGDVTLETGSGVATINGVHGESLTAETGSGALHGGDIDVKSLKAEIGSGGLRFDRVKAPEAKLESGSGGLSVEFLSVVDQISASTGSGGVTLRLPSSQTGDVDISTGSGGIDTDFAIVSNHVQRNHLRGTIGDGKGRIRIEAGSGTVRLLKN
jgi:DUF4097 and DUF4098 domain-containing protein YvlB